MHHQNTQQKYESVLLYYHFIYKWIIMEDLYINHQMVDGIVSGSRNQMISVVCK